MKWLAEFVAAVLWPGSDRRYRRLGTYARTSVMLGSPGYRLGGGTTRS
jgi:hypothetical protein